MQIFPMPISDYGELIEYLNGRKTVAEKNQEIENWLCENLKQRLDGLIVNKEEYISPLLETLVLPITDKCNLTCPYCFAQKGNGNFNFDSYTEKDIDNLLEIIYDKNRDTPTTLVFFGGEPLLKFKLIKYTINAISTRYNGKLNVSYSITTNGTLINEKVAQFFRDNNFAVMLSVDGPDNEYNFRKYSNGESSLGRVLRNIEVLKEKEVSFEVRATITSNNPYILETIMFLEELRTPFTAVFAYSSENATHGELTSYDDITLERIKDGLGKVYDYYSEKLKKCEKIYNLAISEFFETLEYRTVKERACTAGLTYHTVMSNGDMYSCAHLMNDKKYIVQNVRHFENGKWLSDTTIPIKVSEIEDCQKCWAKNLCSGGCTSRKVLANRKTSMALPQVECKLQKLQFELYLRLYYLYKIHTCNQEKK